MSINILSQNRNIIILALLGLLFQISCKKDEKEPINNYDPPTITIKASPSVLPYFGGTSIITWTTTNTDIVYCNDVGYDPAKGFIQTDFINYDSTFIFIAKGPGGQKIDSIILKVDSSPLPSISLSANPPIIPYGGGTCIITWTALYTDTVYFNNVGYDQAIGFIQTGFINQESTFTFIAKGPGGEKSASIILTIAPPPTDEEMLCAGPWKLVKFESSSEGVPFHEIGVSAECQQDDRLTFYLESKIVQMTLGTFLCPGETQFLLYESEWTLNDSAVSGLGKPRYIQTITNDSLIWIYEDMGAVGDSVYATLLRESYIIEY